MRGSDIFGALLRSIPHPQTPFHYWAKVLRSTPQHVALEPTSTHTPIWQNIMPQDALAAEHSRLLPPTQPVDATLETTWLSMWSTHPTSLTRARGPHKAQHTPFREPLLHVPWFPPRHGPLPGPSWNSRQRNSKYRLHVSESLDHLRWGGKEPRLLIPKDGEIVGEYGSIGFPRRERLEG